MKRKLESEEGNEEDPEPKKQRLMNVQSRFPIPVNAITSVLQFYSQDPEELLTVAKTSKAFFEALKHVQQVKLYGCILKNTEYIKMKVFQNVTKLRVSYSCERRFSVKKFIEIAGNLKHLTALAILANITTCLKHEKSKHSLPKESKELRVKRPNGLFKNLESFFFIINGKRSMNFLGVLDSINEQDCKLKKLDLYLRQQEFSLSKYAAKLQHLEYLRFRGCDSHDLRGLKNLKKISVSNFLDKMNDRKFALVDSPVLNRVHVNELELDSNWCPGGPMNWVFSTPVTRLYLSDTVILNLVKNTQVLETFQNAKSIENLSIVSHLSEKSDIENMMKILGTLNFVKHITFLFRSRDGSVIHTCEAIKYAAEKLETLSLRTIRSDSVSCDCDLSFVKIEKLKRLVLRQRLTINEKFQEIPSNIQGLMKSNPSLVVERSKDERKTPMY